MADIVNKLEILSDFKKNSLVTQKDINNNLIYSSLVSVNLINTIKEFYDTSVNLSVNTSDAFLTSFLEVSFKNFFLNNYMDKYKKENVTKKGYITKLKKNNDTTTYKLIEENDTEDFKLPIIRLANDRGLNVSYEKNSDVEDTISICHTNTRSGSSNNYSKEIYNNDNYEQYGYNVKLNLNSYDIDKYGHVSNNTKRTVTFPNYENFNRTIFNGEIGWDDYCLNATTKKSNINIETNIKNFTLFKITFYCKEVTSGVPGFNDTYVTLLITLKELQQRCLKSLIVNGSPGLTIYFSIDESNSSKNIISISSEQTILYMYLMKVEGYTVA